jgi:hypothetical protein
MRNLIPPPKGQRVFLVARIFRQPLAFCAQRPEIDFFAGGIVSVWVEMEQRHAAEDIGCQPVITQIEEVVFEQEIPFADNGFEIEVPGAEIGLFTVPVRGGNTPVGQVREQGKMTAKVVLYAGSEGAIGLRSRVPTRLEVADIVRETSE